MNLDHPTTPPGRKTNRKTLMKRDQDILSEITALKERIKNLSQLLELRGVANRLESEMMNGTSSKQAIGIISEIICRRFNTDLTRLVSPGRKQSIVLPRQVTFYLIRSLTGTPFERIGEAFNRDHGTVIHACRSIDDRIKTQPVFAQQLQEMANECRDILGKNQDQPGGGAFNRSSSP